MFWFYINFVILKKAKNTPHWIQMTRYTVQGLSPVESQVIIIILQFQYSLIFNF